MNSFPTSEENIAINLIFAAIGESRYFRTREEYTRIAVGLPQLKELHGLVNDQLRAYAEAGYAPYEICYFRKGDRYIWYKEFPKSISMETVRTALRKFFPPDMRPKRDVTH